MVRQASYLRVSSVGQEENYSLPEQERDCDRYGHTKGYAQTVTYNDGAQKSYTLNRPGLNQLMQDAKHGLFDVVVVGRFDRFSRNQAQQAVAIYQLSQYGVKVESASQPVPDGALGDLIRNSYAFAAELELYNIRERTTGGRKARIREGKLLPGAHPLYGYTWANAHQKHGKDAYLLDPETEWVVRLVYAEVLHGKSLRRIAYDLEQRHIPTPGQVLLERGQLPKKRTVSSVWRISTLVRMLSNPAYIGQHSGWRHSTEEVKTRDAVTGEIQTSLRTIVLAADNPERVFMPEGVCPPIVDEATFNAVQAILKRNKQQALRHLANPEAALLRSGFALCGHCGRYMQVKFHKGNGHYRYWCASERDTKSIKCPGGQWSVKTVDLDTLVWDWVLRAFDEPDIIRAAFETWKADQSEGRSYEYDRLDSLQDLIKQAESRWQNCLRSAAEAKDERTRAQFTHMADIASVELNDLQQDHEKLAGVLERQDTKLAQVETLIELGSRALDNLRAADYQDKRTFLSALGLCIRVKSLTDYKITWRLDQIMENWVAQQLSVPIH